MTLAPTVLVAEDEELLVLLLSRLLEDEGYRVLTARDGDEALLLARQAAGLVRLVITDLQMPRMDGLELAAHLAELHPCPPVLFISGYQQEGGELPGPFLTKPFKPDELTMVVRRMLESRQWLVTTRLKHPVGTAQLTSL